MKLAKYEKYRRSFPYYKVQYWVETNKAWKDIQEAIATPAEAHKRGQKLGRVYRVMEITEKGRHPYNG